MKIKSIALLTFMFFMVGCATVTINPKDTNKLFTEPTYQKSKSFFLWGLAGEHRIDVKKICSNSKVIQLQSQKTFIDTVFTLITYGIYSPHSVKVWCK